MRENFNLNNEKGSITVFVLVALLFMSAFLIISYANNVNKSEIAKEQLNIIQNIYKGNENIVDSYQEAYTALRNKSKQIITQTEEDTSIIKLSKTFEDKISNYKIYGNSLKQRVEYNIYPTKEGFLPNEKGTYPVLDERFDNPTYTIIEIKKGQTMYFDYTGSDIGYVRVRCIDKDTDEIVCDLVDKDATVTESDYYSATIYYTYKTEQKDGPDGYVTAKKDFKLGIMYLEEKPSDYNMKIYREYNEVGDFITDETDENFNKYVIQVKITDSDEDSANSIIYKIVLNSPLLENEYIDYAEQKVYRNDGTIENIELPELYTFEDYTKIEILTQVAPSKLEISYTGYNIE